MSLSIAGSRVGALLATALLFTACSSDPSDEEVEDLGETIAVDLEQLFETIEETAEEVAELDTAKVTVEEECWESTGDCEACSTLEGTSGEGTFETSMTELPCGQEWEALARTRTYTIEESSLTGSWMSTDGSTYDWTMEGVQNVEYVVQSPRPADRVYDASWELDELVAQTIDGELGDYALEADYEGYIDLTTRIDLTGNADSGEGTVIFEDDDNDQVICTLEREDEIVTVICD